MMTRLFNGRPVTSIGPRRYVGYYQWRALAIAGVLVAIGLGVVLAVVIWRGV